MSEGGNPEPVPKDEGPAIQIRPVESPAGELRELDAPPRGEDRFIRPLPNETLGGLVDVSSGASAADETPGADGEPAPGGGAAKAGTPGELKPGASDEPIVFDLRGSDDAAPPPRDSPPPEGEAITSVVAVVDESGRVRLGVGATGESGEGGEVVVPALGLTFPDQAALDAFVEDVNARLAAGDPLETVLTPEQLDSLPVQGDGRSLGEVVGIGNGIANEGDGLGNDLGHARPAPENGFAHDPGAPDGDGVSAGQAGDDGPLGGHFRPAPAHGAQEAPLLVEEDAPSPHLAAAPSVDAPAEDGVLAALPGDDPGPGGDEAGRPDEAAATAAASPEPEPLPLVSPDDGDGPVRATEALEALAPRGFAPAPAAEVAAGGLDVFDLPGGTEAPPGLAAFAPAADPGAAPPDAIIAATFALQPEAAFDAPAAIGAVIAPADDARARDDTVVAASLQDEEGDDRNLFERVIDAVRGVFIDERDAPSPGDFAAAAATADDGALPGPDDDDVEDGYNE